FPLLFSREPFAGPRCIRRCVVPRNVAHRLQRHARWAFVPLPASWWHMRRRPDEPLVLITAHFVDIDKERLNSDRVRRFFPDAAVIGSLHEIATTHLGHTWGP